MPLSDTGLTKATQSVGEYPNPVEKTVLLQINSLQWRRSIDLHLISKFDIFLLNF